MKPEDCGTDSDTPEEEDLQQVQSVVEFGMETTFEFNEDLLDTSSDTYADAVEAVAEVFLQNLSDDYEEWLLANLQISFTNGDESDARRRRSEPEIPFAWAVVEATYEKSLPVSKTI